MKRGKNFQLLEISADIAEAAGRLRGQHKFLRALDAIQLAAAIEAEADAFITNDELLKRIKQIEIIVLKDFA